MQKQNRFNKYLYTHEVGLMFLDDFNAKRQQRELEKQEAETQEGVLQHGIEWRLQKENRG